MGYLQTLVLRGEGVGGRVSPDVALGPALEHHPVSVVRVEPANITVVITTVTIIGHMCHVL